jgi:peroxiredoxin
MAIGGLVVAAGAAGVLVLGPRRKRPAGIQATGPLVGKAAPEIADGVELWVNGKEAELRQLKGKAVLLFFWHPRDEGGKSLAALPHVGKLADSFERKGLVTIGLCVLDEPKEVEPTLREHGVKFRVGLDCDADVHRSYRIENVKTPYCYLVDTRGMVAWEGRPDALAESAIEACLP